MDGKDFRKIEAVIQALRRHMEFQRLLEGVNPFLIYRTDTGTVLARGIYGFEQVKAKANEIRKRYGLKWEQVKFKADRSQTGSYKQQQNGRKDYSSNYNPSKRGRFRVRINPDGSTSDID